MLDFSFAELALVIIVAVVFIGPKELPVVVKACAKAMRAVRSLANEFRQAMDEVTRESGISEVENDIKLIRGDDGKLYESYPNALKTGTGNDGQ